MFQYIAQTYEKYSHDEARAFTNIKTKIAYAAEDLQDAEFISQMLGIRTKKVVNRTTSLQHQNTNDSKSSHSQAIPLLRAEEIMKLPASVSLIIKTGFAPVKAKQFIWYRDHHMQALPKPPVLLPQQTIHPKPFQHPQVNALFLKNQDHFVDLLEED